MPMGPNTFGGTPMNYQPMRYQPGASDGGVIGGTPPMGKPQTLPWMQSQPLQGWRMPMLNQQPFGMMMPQAQSTQPQVQPSQTQMPGWQQQFPGATPQNPRALSGAELYLQQNPDVAAAGADAWEHYNLFGRNEGRQWTGAQPAARPAPTQSAASTPPAQAPAPPRDAYVQQPWQAPGAQGNSGVAPVKGALTYDPETYGYYDTSGKWYSPQDARTFMAG